MSEPRGLRLLSLDGGGIRGLSELLILSNIMKRIQEQLKLKEEPLPCEYFDMIGGTSTGGLIAIMLGRLGMSVDDAIACYGGLAEKVFTKVKWFGDGKFKASKLKKEIQNIVERKSGPGQTEELMVNANFQGQQCNTFVCAMPADDMGTGVPHLFRSYRAPQHCENANCTIWEASRATSAAPTFFKRITIGPPGIRLPYIDGGLGCNNPTEWMLEEAKLIFPGQRFQCIVSIGTGQAHTTGIPNPSLVQRSLQRLLPTDVIRALNGMATDCERTAQAMARRFQERPNIYFRFNVEQGLQDVGLAHWEKLGKVAAHTLRYTRTVDVSLKLGGAAQALAIQGRLTAAAIPEEPGPSNTPIQFRPIYSTAFGDEPRNTDESHRYYHDLVPYEQPNGCRLSVGNGAFSLSFIGSSPVRWKSIFDAELLGPVRVETTVDLSHCKTNTTPSGAGVLVILPDEKDNSKVCKFFFIVEPSEVPQLHILKQKPKPAGGRPFTPLHSAVLSHCQGKQNVQVEVTVLDGTVTVSTNGVRSTVLTMATSGGPNRLRAFGLCGIGPQRLTWTSFKVSVEDSKPDTMKDVPLPKATRTKMWLDYE